MNSCTHDRYPRRSRRSVRLKRYDYSWPGWYYVTICTAERVCNLGRVEYGKMILNEWGRIVSETWQWIPTRYPYVDLDDFVVMPNHLHGVLIINPVFRRGVSRNAPTEPPKIKPLGQLIGAFKTVSTKKINEMRATPGSVFWQRNYYEHIIRTRRDLNRIRAYIWNNPLQWTLDEGNAYAKR
jgi:putative transposase